MKAMVLAAGMGTRLKPLTDSIPKALVEVGGIPMLERVVLNLKKQGFEKIVINVHHFGNKIQEFLSGKEFGVTIQVSDESKELLDTGGGIVKAFDLLFNEDSSPVLIHNVDILSNADLRALMENCVDRKEGPSLLVSDRDSSRKLIFDSKMRLIGWHNLKDNAYRWVATQEDKEKELAFSGIYSITRESVAEIKRIMGGGKYSIMEYFLNSERKISVKGFEQKELRIIDIGKPATLLQASKIYKD